VPLDIGLEVAALRRMTTTQLRQRFAEATAVNNKPWLIKHRLATPGAGRGRPVRARPPARPGTGQ
jgi:hypothetical protein